MRILWLMLLVAVPIFGTDFFASLSYEEALLKAKKENKPIFVDFYAVWCGPCKKLDKTTWSNAQVAEYLSQHTIPLKIDAEKFRDVARPFSVQAYPTLVFINPDGTEKGRLVGYRGPDRFLIEAKGIMTGVAPEAQLKAKIDASKDLDLMDVLQYAGMLAQKGKHAEALEKYLEVFEKSRWEGALAGVRSSFLLGDIHRLGRAYPPANEALQTLQEQALKGLRDSDDPKKATVYGLEYLSLNRELGQDQKSLQLFHEINSGELKASSALKGLVGDQVFPLLVESKDYALIGQNVDLDARLSRLEGSFRHIEGAFTSGKFSKAEQQRVLEIQKIRLLENVGDLYQAAVALDRMETMAAAEKVLLGIDMDDQARNVLAWHAFLTGKPNQRHLDLAKQAYEGTNGQDPSIIDTYTRLMAHFGRKEAALKLLEDALLLFQDPKEHLLLRQTQTDLQAL